MGSVHRLILEEGVQEARRIAAVDRIERLCVDAAYGVLSDEKGNIGIAHAGFAMAALPHKRTDKTVWERESGPIKLLSSSGDERTRWGLALAVEGLDGLVDGRVEGVGVAEGAVGEVVALQ